MLTQRQQTAITAIPPAQRKAKAQEFRSQNAQKKMNETKVAQPAAKTRPGRKAPVAKQRGGRSQGNFIAPKNLSLVKQLTRIFDPTTPQTVPAMQAEGKAFPVTGMISHEFKVHSDPVLVIATNTGSSANVGYIIPLDTAYHSKTAEPAQEFVIPTLAMTDTQNGPSACRAMRYAVSCVNCTNKFEQGGRVTYLNSSQRLPYVPKDSMTDVLNFASVVNSVKATPLRRAINGEVLHEPQHLVGFPTDQTAFHTYNTWDGVITIDKFLQHVSVAYGDHGSGREERRPMSVVVWVFEPTSKEQTYAVTIRSSYYSRWPLTSVPGQAMAPVPTASPGAVNSAAHFAEHTANELKKIVVPSVEAGGVVGTALAASKYLRAAQVVPGVAEAEMLLPLLA